MTDFTNLRAAENQLQFLMAASDKQILAQGLRLLALYVAAFKEQYGDLDPAIILSYLKDESVNPETMRIFETGLYEAISMLNMVRKSYASAERDPKAKILN